MKSEFVAFNWKICQQTLSLLFSIAVIVWLAPRSGYSPLSLCIPFTCPTALTFLIGLCRHLFVI